jgi:O-antigen ligase
VPTERHFYSGAVSTARLETWPSLAAGLRYLVDREARGAVVLAVAVPFLFVHERFQPELAVDAGSTSIDIRLSDVAVLVVVIAAFASAVRLGLSCLRPTRFLWVLGALLLAWLAFETFRPVSLDDARFDDNVVSFLKLVEYALLAIAVPLLVRRAEDLTIILGALVLWGIPATTVALFQFFGLDVFDGGTAGQRQPSFIGYHDLAALAAVATSVALARIVVPRRRTVAPRLFACALVGGTLGLVLAGSVAAVAGLAVGAVALGLAARVRFSPSARQLLAVAAVVAVVGGGVAAVRADALDDLVSFLGVRDEAPQGVESYSQRTVLAYIGLRIFEDHPIVGVGWQRSSRPEVFQPYLADAHKRFPDVVDLAFPAPGREWGVQSLYIQTLADAGVIGLLLLLAVGAAGLALAWRTVVHAPNPWAAGAGLAALCALLTLAGEWASLGIVAGIPLQAATCLLLGLAAAGAATAEDELAI